ncbi:MAG: surface-adhesin E family protein [Sphingomonas sp.]
MLKWIAAAAVLLMPAAAQAQAQQWYVTAANAENTALIFVDRTSVSLKGNEATASLLIVSIDDGNGKDEAILFTLVFDCQRKTYRTLTGQMLDIDGNPVGEMMRDKSDWIPMRPDSFFNGPQEFACGGSVNPSPDMLIGPNIPVRAGTTYLHDQHDKKKD